MEETFNLDMWTTICGTKSQHVFQLRTYKITHHAVIDLPMKLYGNISSMHEYTVHIKSLGYWAGLEDLICERHLSLKWRQF